MELDKRIKDTGSILTCFSIEAAKQYLGQKGYFTNSIDDYQSLEQFTDFKTLSEVTDDDTPFCTGQCCYQFFLPAEFVRPAEEKKWRPFTNTEEFFKKTNFTECDLIYIRSKPNHYEYHLILTGWTYTELMLGSLRIISLDELFQKFELWDGKDKFVPFGVEE